jgi:anionic cell wall polymer biosynthesis LytR-Cps2A-Psr (LCP) family protein
LNIFFSVSPGVYYILNLQFSKNETHLIRIPQELLVEQFAQSISTFDQAYLYGGPVFVTSLLERLFNTRIPKFISCSKDDIVSISNILGGLTVDVDAKASSFLGIPRGKQKLDSKIVTKYLSPAVSGAADAQERQTQALRNLFDEIRFKNVVPTLMTANQIIGSSETNFSATEIIEQFSRFSGKTNWIYKEDFLPASYIQKNGRNCYDPDLINCRRIISDEKE